LTGKTALIVRDKGRERTSGGESVAELRGGRLINALAAREGITVRRLKEGIWRNGGWILRGGLLVRVQLDSVTYDLFGKEVVRRSPYFPFHRDPPEESGNKTPAGAWSASGCFCRRM